MGNTGWVIAGTGVNDDSVGDTAWSDPDRITVDDAFDATAALTAGPKISNYLKATNFDFLGAGLFPSDAITGIEVRIQRGQSISFITDNIVRLVNEKGNVTGEDKATTDEWGTYPDNVEYGSPSKLWGLAPTAEDVLNSNWGVVFSCDSAPASSTASVDAIWIRITFPRETTVKSPGTVSEGPGTIGTKIVSKRYPNVEGLVAGATKQTGIPYLVEENKRGK